VTGILPGRPATRQRLFVASLIVVVGSFLNLIPLEFGPFGSPWPIVLLWAVCGWSGLGASLATSCLLFGLGLWVDLLTGTLFGTWALLATITHGLTLVGARYLGSSSVGPLVNCAISGVIMLAVMALFGLWQHKSFDLIGSVLPILSAVLLYRFVASWFELSEDET
jgi:hypothetical protein